MSLNPRDHGRWDLSMIASWDLGVNAANLLVDEVWGYGGLNQATKALLPVLTGCDVVLVEIGLEASDLKADEQLLRKVLILARVGDEDFELARITRRHRLSQCRAVPIDQLPGAWPR